MKTHDAKGRSAALRGRGVLRVLAKFGRDRDGATAIEFALVASPFFLMLLMIMQVALFQFAQQSLNSATRMAARQIMTGKLAANAYTAQTFRDALICPQLLIGLNCTSVSVSAAKISLTSDATAGTGIYKFINAGSKTLKPSSQLSGFCLGSGDDYIFLNVSLNITTDSNPLFKLLKSYGVQELRSTALYRNEPFQTGGATC